MTWTVILALGSGTLQEGFPLVTAKLKNQARPINIQFKGSLLPVPDLEVLQRRWKVCCSGFQSSRSNSRIKIKPTSTAYVSENNPRAIYEGLKEEMQKWLNADEFYRKIEVNLRTQIGNTSEYIQIFLECDDSEICELPWDAWNFREAYCNSEIISSPSEYRILPQQETQAGIYLPSRGRILCVLGNSKGIDVKKDTKSIAQSLGDRCQLEFLDNPTPEEFNDHLFDEKGWQIFFFAGHSDSDNNATNGRLHINQNPANNTITVNDFKIGVKRASFKGLQLLIFNSCSSLGLAADLVSQNYSLPSIIVMRAPIPDPIAHDFVKSLFRYLADGEPLFLAMRKAKDDLLHWESRFPGASGIPVLCQHPNFEELTLPRRDATKPLISAADGVSNRPNHPQFTIPTKVMQRTSISLAVLAIGYILIGPIVASVANKIGMKNHKKGQLFIAEKYYQLANLLNLNYAASYYNLADLYESLNEKEYAEKAMKEAARRGSTEANAEISRSLILNNQPQEALKFVAACLENTQYDGVKAACFKNRGWVRLTQKQYDAAEADLRIAIKFRDDSPEAQCLLAEVLETKGKSQEALEAWNKALQYSNYRIPKQDECIQIAQQRLQAKGNIK
ncbi:CHAT domain-containing protein [Microcoleus sp. LEGE 07076]|uniref:CHAT domain-containing tetratricopeptide repeat protein n=1 Tax=Microcoleus sp. LEGE 07076 TaxID=915322 RepID=UPI00187FAFB3|nr:CHAT domain-containing protein [Microcoleus sp. LEGE 07076]MBE9183869.1 CHAT domain-containing protein [Microcoleus sp. LEGE 07076]